MTRPMRIVVAGSVAAVASHGGWACALLHYVLGLRELGHDVRWIDPIAATALTPAGAPLAESDNAAAFRRLQRQFDLQAASVLLQQEPDVDAHGETPRAVEQWLADSDLLINVSGALTLEPLLGVARRRVYLDLDPGFTQLWERADGVQLPLDRHTDFVTIGPGLAACPAVPSNGRRWLTTLQPIVLALWPDVGQVVPQRWAFTTVGNWRGYGSMTHAGVFFGQRAHSFRQFLTLPDLTGEQFTLALAIHQDEVADREALARHGWSLIDPSTVAGSPDAYRTFVQQSAAELAVAKSGYVDAPTGWFSDRSICYLASGRPVVAQETGFSQYLPAGRGVLSFASVEQAAENVARVKRDYAMHARAARDLAEAYFDSRVVLRRLLRQLELAA